MEIKKLVIKNFRLLKDIEIDLEKDLSLIIGKNNCGKTSALYVLKKFLGEHNDVSSFKYEDFNIDFQNILYQHITQTGKDWESVNCRGIELYIYIQYDETDNLANIAALMLELNPENRTVILKLEYMLDYIAFTSLKETFEKYYEDNKKSRLKKKELYNRFISSTLKRFFKTEYRSILFDAKKGEIDSNVFRILDKREFDLHKIISLRYIEAKREPMNKDNDVTLSGLSSKYYENIKEKDEVPAIQKFESALIKADLSLNKVYNKLFENIIEKIKKFGGVKENETIMKIISTLGQQELLKNNTTMVYEAGENQLPEGYNGLGYLNLISIIMQVETILAEFRCDNKANRMPSDINLFFIEEPEAHTHPQMQYVFIKNIKNLLRDGSKGANVNQKINLQTIITTHSSHIVSDCDFDDIKYFQRISSTSVISKNIKCLEAEYKDESDPGNSRFKFLKQYLTLNYAEVFFADKVILYEGDTERILLPAMMRKIDQEEGDTTVIPLLAQNISLLQAGANSQLFDKFLQFIGIKTLIITDIDAGKEEITLDKNANERISTLECEVKDGTTTTNNALKHYYGLVSRKSKKSILQLLKEKRFEQKILKRVNDKWRNDRKGTLMVAYQTEEDNETSKYYPRSFEDAFWFCNQEFMMKNFKKFKSLKNVYKIEEKEHSVYDLAGSCIKSKPAFAMDILLCSKADDITDFSNWNIPPYIREGLIWLRDN